MSEQLQKQILKDIEDLFSDTSDTPASTLKYMKEIGELVYEKIVMLEEERDGG